jgi:hypothetical protein
VIKPVNEHHTGVAQQSIQAVLNPGKENFTKEKDHKEVGKAQQGL